MRKTAPKKKMNRKMKRTIRKSVSAMFMATALIIAAIPVQENAAAGTLATGDGTTTVETEPLSENSYPEVVDEIPNIDYDIYSDDWLEGKAIVDEGGGLYVEKVMYRVKKLDNTNEYAIVGYNKTIIPRDNKTEGTLIIPNLIAKEFVKFKWSKVEEYYYKDGKPLTGKLQSDYDRWHQENIAKPVVDFEKMNPEEIRKYALDLYACNQAFSADCIAQKVRVIESTTDDDPTYVPFNIKTEEFAMDGDYLIRVIAAGAFSEHAFSEIQNSENQDGEESTNVRIYNLIINDNIRGIGDDAFKGNTNIKSIIVNNPITAIYQIIGKSRKRFCLIFSYVIFISFSNSDNNYFFVDINTSTIVINCL